MPSIFLSSLIFFPSFIFIFYLLILFLEYGNAIFQATSNSLAQANPLTARTVNYGCAPATAPQRQACHRPELTQPSSFLLAYSIPSNSLENPAGFTLLERNGRSAANTLILSQ